MVKLYGYVLIALALVGGASASALTASGSSLGCNHADTKTNPACVKAWIASESKKALNPTAKVAEARGGGRRDQEIDQNVTEEPTEDSSLADGGPTDGSSLRNEEPADDTTQEPTEYPPVGSDVPPLDGQSTDEPPTDGEPTDEVPTYDLPTDEDPTGEPPVDGTPTDEPTSDNTPTDGEPTDEPSSDDLPTNEPLTATTAPTTTTSAPVTTTTTPPATTTSPPVTTTISPSTSTTAPPPAAPMCTAKPQRGDQLAGVDIVTDASCVKGGLGCLGTVCRFCKRWDSASSKHLTACDVILNTASTTTTPSTAPVTTPVVPTTPAPQASSQADTQCGAWLSTGDRAVGILIALDQTCVKGGVGCITTECRYCRSWETTQSRHMKSCTSFASVAAPLAVIPSTISTTPGTGPVCDNLLSSGDRAVGILVVSDNKCVNGGLGCIGSSCRYCRVKDTPQSKHLMQCSVFPLGPTVEPTPAPTPGPTTATPATSTDCGSWLTTGDRAVGIFVAADSTCTRGGVGCIRSMSCRYCRKQDTTQSHHLKECSQFSVVSPAVETSSVVSNSFGAASDSKTLGAGTPAVIASVCVVGALAIAGFVVKRFTGSEHDVELSTPTFINHRSVSVSTL